MDPPTRVCDDSMDHLSGMNHGQDDKEPIENKMRDNHLYRIIDKDTWMIK
jgi:hypothetical protein